MKKKLICLLVAVVSMFALPNVASAGCLNSMDVVSNPEIVNVQEIPVNCEVSTPTPDRRVVVVERLIIIEYSDGSVYAYYERYIYIEGWCLDM